MLYASDFGGCGGDCSGGCSEGDSALVRQDNRLMDSREAARWRWEPYCGRVFDAVGLVSDRLYRPDLEAERADWLKGRGGWKIRDNKQRWK